MADNVKVLRRRLRSVRNTRQITSAMETVSAAKLRRAQETLQAGRPYVGKLQMLLGHLAASGCVSHPLFTPRPVAKRLLLIVTADRGLAGAFNMQLIRRAEAFLSEAAEPTELVCAGKEGLDYFRSRKWPILFSLTDLGGKVSAARANSLAECLHGYFVSGGVDEIMCLHNSFVSSLIYRTTLQKLLPLDPAALLPHDEGAAQPHREVQYIMEPTPELVLERLLPRYLNSKIYITLADSFAAEHSARVTAMSTATENCNELIDSLTLKMNKARQAAITKEIIEITSGSEAQKG